MSYSALLPMGRVRNVEVRKSNSAVCGWRLPAQTTIPRARMNSSANPISSRYDMPSSGQLQRGLTERAVLVFVAGDGTEQMAIQPRDQPGQCGAARLIEARLRDVLRRCFGGVKAQCLAVVELQHGCDEAVCERFGVTAHARQLLGHRA